MAAGLGIAGAHATSIATARSSHHTTPPLNQTAFYGRHHAPCPARWSSSPGIDACLLAAILGLTITSSA
ncbi:hypothetical protein R1CP_37550 (plasmid) [Rhodococcus opacus]|uniref:Uncharacterized protein n=1 Tax=Rhodococcus opacus TaxID=37919 RepID=A0A1B1KHM2_RHOOP|nr:hypothetical protein R1CP_37550 [Rhodococcus opacus]